MAPAVEQRLQSSSLTHEKRAHTLRGMEFMAGDRKQIATNLFHSDRYFRSCLHSIGMEINIRLGANFSDLIHRLQNSGFVIRHHDRDQLGVWTQGATNILGINQASSIRRN